jgi:hypothetical protein
VWKKPFIFVYQINRLKVKFVIQQVPRAQRGEGGRGIALLIRDLGARRRWVFSNTLQRFTSGKDTVPIVQEARWDRVRNIPLPHRDSIPGPSSP